jgi:hypothetical protein
LTKNCSRVCAVLSANRKSNVSGRVNLLHLKPTFLTYENSTMLT